MRLALRQKRNTRLSPDTEHELRRVLGDEESKRIAPRLERIVYDEYAALRSTGLRAGADIDRQVRRLRNSFGAALRCIDQLSPAVRELLDRPQVPEVFGSRRRSALDTVRTTQAAILELISMLDALPAMKRRGRPRNYRRLWLALRVAIELRDSGVQITVSRSGKFRAVLAAALTELHGTSAPEDFFDVIKTAADIANNPAAERYLHILTLILTPADE